MRNALNTISGSTISYFRRNSIFRYGDDFNSTSGVSKYRNNSSAQYSDTCCSGIKTKKNHNHIFCCSYLYRVIISFTYGINAKVLLATRGLRIPVIACERTTLNTKMYVINKIRRLYIARLAKCLTVKTQYDYDYLGKRFQKKIVMPNPLEFPIRYVKEAKEKIVLTVGAVDRWEDKGFGGLIELWGKLSKKFPDWKLQIAGGGNDFNVGCLRKLIDKFQVQDSVQLLGYRNDVCDLMYKSAVFVLASKQEGMPNCLIEAMSQGCACLSFDCVAGPREIITDGSSGLLVTDQNWQEMEMKLACVLDSVEMRERLATHALKEVERFSVEQIIDKWECVFKNVAHKQESVFA